MLLSSTEYAKVVKRLEQATRSCCEIGMNETEIVSTVRRTYGELSAVAKKQREERAKHQRNERVDGVHKSINQFLKDRPDKRGS